MRKLVEEGPSSVPPLTERQKELLADFKEKTLATKDERRGTATAGPARGFSARSRSRPDERRGRRRLVEAVIAIAVIVLILLGAWAAVGVAKRQVASLLPEDADEDDE
jgi:hypothetical protein